MTNLRRFNFAIWRGAHCAQETGGMIAPASTSIQSMTWFGIDRGRRGASLWVLAVILALGWATRPAAALAPGVGGSKTTLVVFSDRPIAPSAWTSLFAELRKALSIEGSSFAALDTAPELLRGVDVVPGHLMENPIVVKMHGDCRPPAGQLASTSKDTLGWVRREEGRISPFVHVDCTRVAQLISQRIFWMGDEQRSAAMNGALARVILHEWIHIAEQTDQHTRKGISKRAFGSTDLVPDLDLETSRTERDPMAAAQRSRPR